MKFVATMLPQSSLFLFAVCAFAVVPQPQLKWQHGFYASNSLNKAFYTSPALLDVNGDGVNDIIWANFRVSALDGKTGTILWSFWVGNDRNSPDILTSIIGTDTNVAVADINSDGHDEIVTAHTDGLVSAYDRFGNFLPGFPLRPLGRTDPIESLSIFDIDNNTFKEIIIGWGKANNLNVCVLDHTGAIKHGWPQYVANPNANALGIYGPNIAVGDINRDGFGELVVPSDTGKTAAYLHNGTPIPVNTIYSLGPGNNSTWSDVTNYENYYFEKLGWHVPDGSEDSRFYMGTYAPATIADINNDGSDEIIIAGVVYSNPPDNPNFVHEPLYTTPFIYNYDRTRFNDGTNNWESNLPKSGSPLTASWQEAPIKLTNPVVVDIDGDGNKEILTSTFDGKLHCYWLDKTEHHAWPFTVNNPTEGVRRFSSEPVVADLDNDGNLEVIFTSWPEYNSYKGGHLYILNRFGNLLQKVALPYGDNGVVGVKNFDGALATPTVGDVDGDGETEIVVGAVYAGLLVYDLPGAKLGKAPWPTGRHDFSRTGWSSYVSDTLSSPWLFLLLTR